ncbi:Ferrous-iron efflux pump FieF [Sebaldella termitidis]|uniref:Cation diffusion facilitator family transporter n=1 Tax=Sebaldella termitidis (strain ATCC 33386 / NCTC 11300) TaxID=526218 RepID=D1AL66_SEBTE|nr:GNAT family N-acetyltransferase [Sebaldella termitidis]ACZ09209.1 cation diffusion facilitator family transporter [Sebaldella termitidis ATCC 33386]SUI24530.1 Ferrous-iron efflux pump FieF [Sebaldella termitidis]
MDIIKLKEDEIEKLDELKKLDDEFEIPKTEEEYFIINDRDMEMGYAVLEMNEIPVLKRIFIREGYRNTGYGTKLLKYIINWLRSKDYDELIVLDHKNSNKFLERLKFVRNGDAYIRNGLSIKRKKEKKAMLVIIFNLFINIILASLRIVFGYMGNSTALIADGVNSLTDCVSNTIAVVGLKAGSKPEDEHHPFGHGKMESIMSIIIGTLIIVAASNILYENVMKLFRGEVSTQPPALLIGVSIISLIIKAGQFIFIKRNGERLNNTLLLALSKDYKSDFIISTSVVIGIFLSRQVSPMVDSVLGIAVILYIIKEGYGIIRDNSLELLDTQDKEFLEKVYNEVIREKGVENAHDFHMSKSGENIYLFMDIRVNKNMLVIEAHDLSHEISNKLKLKYKNLKDVIIHVEPVY